MKNDKNEYKPDLTLGITMDKNPIVLLEENRKENLMVIGTKNSRKSSYLLPTFAKQIVVCGDKMGATFVTNGVNDSFLIAAVVRHMKRKTQLEIFKPSVNSSFYKELIEDKPYDFDRINNFFNYATLVREKKMIIIDTESYKYGKLSENLQRKIFLHIFLSIQNTKITLGREHYLFIDDADNYIDDLTHILKYGDKFNLYTTLFLESRDRLKNKDIIDINIKNIILLSYLLKEDEEYYDFIINNSTNLKNPDTFFYSILDKNKKILIGEGILASEITKKEFYSLNTVAERLKKEAKVDDNNINIINATKEFNKKYYNTEEQENKIIVDNKCEEIEKEEEFQTTIKNNDNLTDTKETKIKKDNFSNEKIIKENILNEIEPYDGKKYKFKANEIQQKYIDTIVHNNELLNKKKQKEIENTTEEQIFSQMEEKLDKKEEEKENVINKEIQEEIEENIIKKEEKPDLNVTSKVIKKINQQAEHTSSIEEEQNINQIKEVSPLIDEEDDFEESFTIRIDNKEDTPETFEDKLNNSIEKIIEKELSLQNETTSDTKEDIKDNQEINQTNKKDENVLIKAPEDISLTEETDNKNFLDLDSLFEDE